MVAERDESADRARFAAERARMVAQQLRRRGITDERVLAAMGQVPRERFVGASLVEQAYQDRPLPIGFGQTISQPLMVATMLQAMALRGAERVLEVGAGCGYQTALLSGLAARVYAVEIVGELCGRARGTLSELGCDNVELHCADGGLGHPPAAPYDAIVVAAAPDSVPPPLIEQLATGGRLLIPVGGWLGQSLQRIARGSSGEVTMDKLCACLFVPLVGEHGRRGPGRSPR